MKEEYKGENNGHFEGQWGMEKNKMKDEGEGQGIR